MILSSRLGRCIRITAVAWSVYTVLWSDLSCQCRYDGRCTIYRKTLSWGIFALVYWQICIFAGFSGCKPSIISSYRSDVFTVYALFRISKHNGGFGQISCHIPRSSASANQIERQLNITGPFLFSLPCHAKGWITENDLQYLIFGLLQTVLKFICRIAKL